MHHRRAFRTWLAAGAFALLPAAHVHAQFVTPAESRWLARPESPIAAPAMRRHAVAAPDTAAQASRREPSPAAVAIAADESGPSYEAYALWGIAIGGGIGLAAGAIADRGDPCPDCWVNAKGFGVVLGGVFGWLIGSIAYFGSQSPAR